MINCIYNKLVCMCSNNIPVSHCKDTHNFDKTNNYFKEDERKGDQVSDLLCPKLTELLYNSDYLACATTFIFNAPT